MQNGELLVSVRELAHRHELRDICDHEPLFGDTFQTSSNTKTRAQPEKSAGPDQVLTAVCGDARAQPALSGNAYWSHS